MEKSSDFFDCIVDNPIQTEKIPFKHIYNSDKLRYATAERNIALFVTCHSALRYINHLSELTKMCFNGVDKFANRIQLHRTKSTGLIRHILFRYFKNDLKSDIGISSYIMLLDESMDINVSKELGFRIIYLFEKKLCHFYIFQSCLS